MTSTQLLRTATILGLLLSLALVTVTPVTAIPAFARKYGSSCQTCHIAYPKLNAYGEAFRLLGYRLPGETEDQVEQPPTALGSDAYKRVWPNAVWPTTIPSHVPLAVTSEFLVQSTDENDDFIFPSEVALVAAGTSGDNISYFGEIAFEQEAEDGEFESEAGVEHIDVRFIRMLHDSLAFNLKVGAFQPELVQAFDHARRLTVANYDSMFAVQTLAVGGAAEVGGHGHGGEGGIALPAVARGFEGYGVVHHRFQWAAGLVNGLEPGQDSFDANDRKDTYGRVSYKWGGLAPDGSNADTYAGSAKNWQETSFELGAFAYFGDGSGILVPVDGHEEEGHGDEGHEEEPAEEEHDALMSNVALANTEPEELAPAFLEPEDSTRYGLDFNLLYKDFNIFGAYLDAEDDLRAFAEDHDGGVGVPLPDESGTFAWSSWFLEVDAVLKYPWLHGAVRYEAVDLAADHAEDFERAVVSITGLVRANVKTTLEYAWRLDDTALEDDDVLWLNLGIAF